MDEILWTFRFWLQWQLSFCSSDNNFVKIKTFCVLVKVYSISSVLAMETLRSCTKPSIYDQFRLWLTMQTTPSWWEKINKILVSPVDVLTHWSWDKMADLSKTTFSNFVNANAWISIKISLNFVPWGQINNIPALVQVMAWRLPGDTTLFQPMIA